MADQADAIVALIKRPGHGAALEQLLRWAAIADPFPTAAAQAETTLASPSRHLTLQTMAVPYAAKRHPWDDIVIEQAVFGPHAGLPFQLDPAAETPASARPKLSQDTVGGEADRVARGDRRVSYFMFDATVIEVTFRAGMIGIEQVLAARLGS